MDGNLCTRRRRFKGRTEFNSMLAAFTLRALSPGILLTRLVFRDLSRLVGLTSPTACGGDLQASGRQQQAAGHRSVGTHPLTQTDVSVGRPLPAAAARR